MNERILNLVGQARIFAWENETHWSANLERDKLFEEKFAELIVRECLNIVEPTEDSGDEWCVTLKGAAQEIKQHFGVEL